MKVKTIYVCFELAFSERGRWKWHWNRKWNGMLIFFSDYISNDAIFVNFAEMKVSIPSRAAWKLKKHWNCVNSLKQKPKQK